MHIYESKSESNDRFVYTDVFYSSDDKMFYISQYSTDKEERAVTINHVELSLGQVAKISEASGRAYLSDFLNDYKLE